MGGSPNLGNLSAELEGRGSIQINLPTVKDSWVLEKPLQNVGAESLLDCHTVLHFAGHIVEVKVAKLLTKKVKREAPEKSETTSNKCWGGIP